MGATAPSSEFIPDFAEMINLMLIALKASKEKVI
jgi:hypothetical protein